MENKLKTFIVNKCDLKHSGKTNFAVTIKGETYKAKNIDDIVDKIYSSLPKFRDDTEWKLCKTSLENGLGNNESLFDILPQMLKEACVDILKAKTKIIETKESNQGSSFNSFTKELTELPNEISFNDIDKIILNEIRYCPFDDYVYLLRKGQLSIIGDFPLVKKDPTMNHLCFELKTHLGYEMNEGQPLSISEYVGRCTMAANKMKHFLINELKNQLDAGLSWENISIEVPNPENPESPDVFMPSNFATDENTNKVEESADAYCVDYMLHVMPGSLIATRTITIKSKYTNYEELTSDASKTVKKTVWNNYFFEVTKTGEALTEALYLKNVFNIYAHEIKDLKMFQLPEQPVLYTDDDSIDALNHFSLKKLNENLKGIECYKELEQCKNLMLLKSWMKPEEFKFCMAWIYATIFPSKSNSKIALLLWTGGGTGKSSLVQMVKYAIALGTGTTPEKLYFEIKGDTFDKDDKRDWIPDGKAGITKSVLINVDEATTKSIELYKDFSGSADKNILNIRRNYENAVDYDITGRFIFTTNKGLQLNSDDGSLLRRVALIKHSDIKNNISAEGLSNNEIVLEYKKQIPMMIAVGKKCTEDILAEGFKSIDEYSMRTEAIASNLKESTATSNNTIIYEEIWNRLCLKAELDSSLKEDECIKVQGGALRELYNSVANDFGEDTKYFAGFKHFIMDNPSLFMKPCYKRQARNFLKAAGQTGQLEKDEHSCNNIWHLFKLKNPVIE